MTHDQIGAMYGDGARDLQDRFDTRRLADTLAAVTVHDELTDDDIGLIRAQSTVWMSTVDPDGWPDVSYKGGDVGFVEVVSPTELRIPWYDGNGMMRSLGNIVDMGRVALLFIDTSRPWRMRVHGTAVVSTDEADLTSHVGAHAVVIVTPVRIFPNCGRYIHRADAVSEHVPRDGADQPFADWKRTEGLYDALSASDQARLDAERSGG
jgi:predicted pyridoxine 5'-phosphate oxidase superfamily flavin-nucleotide-binding protein